MAKHKKKHSKKDDVSDDILDAAALSIRKYRKVTNEIGKLSTGQKLVGGVMLLAAGYFYLDKVKSDEGDDSLFPGLSLLLPKSARPKADPEPETPEAAPVKTAAPRKVHKNPKTGKGPGTFGRKPAASPDDL
jgi:hypothetical protein